MASQFIPLSIKQYTLLNSILEVLENNPPYNQPPQGYIYLTVGNNYESYDILNVISYITYIRDEGKYRIENRELLNGIRNWWISYVKNGLKVNS